MGSVNSIPVVSQAKSAVQAIGGDCKGARKTQEDFSRQCIVVSQVRSAVEACCGDKEAARNTQLQFLRNVGTVVDAVPVVGHVKGVVHYSCGNKEKGDRSMKSASRTIVVCGLGIAGGIVAGPGGAVAGGALGGATMDGLVTAVDSAVHKEFRPEGTVANIVMLADDKIDKKQKLGIGFDTVVGIAFDGLMGVGAFKLMRISLYYRNIRAVDNLKGNAGELLGALTSASLKNILSYVMKILKETILKEKGSLEHMLRMFLKKLTSDNDFVVEIKEAVDRIFSRNSVTDSSSFSYVDPAVCKRENSGSAHMKSGCAVDNENDSCMRNAVAKKYDNSGIHLKTAKDENENSSNMEVGDEVLKAFIHVRGNPKEMYAISVHVLSTSEDSERRSECTKGNLIVSKMSGRNILSDEYTRELIVESQEVDLKDVDVAVQENNNIQCVKLQDQGDGSCVIEAEMIDRANKKHIIWIVLSLTASDEPGVNEDQRSPQYAGNYHWKTRI